LLDHHSRPSKDRASPHKAEISVPKRGKGSLPEQIDHCYSRFLLSTGRNVVRSVVPCVSTNKTEGKTRTTNLPSYQRRTPLGLSSTLRLGPEGSSGRRLNRWYGAKRLILTGMNLRTRRILSFPNDRKVRTSRQWQIQ